MPTSHDCQVSPEHSTGNVVDVLVIGAGPTGLVAAAEALRHGLSVRIIERRAARGTFSKALVLHARTLEVFATMGIDEEIRAVGAPFAALNTHFGTSRTGVRVNLLGLPWGDTQFPYWLSVPQYDTERVLEAHVGNLGGVVEWSTGLRNLTEHGDHLDAEVRGDSGTEIVQARWVIGCDGGRSTVRGLSGVTLHRTGAGATFLLADVKSTSDLVENEGHAYLASEGLLLIVPMPEPGRWRLIAHVPSPVPGMGEAEPTIDAAELDSIIRQRSGIEFGSHDVSWTSQFDLTHGVADRFRAGRVFLAGDAAHIHSPVGGQGLNTGVQDAHNLLWKIAQARRLPPQQAEALLDSYESERRGTAVPMVRGVARMTVLMTSRLWVLRRALALLAPRVLARPSVQTKLGRGIGMLNLAYSGGSLGPEWSKDRLLAGHRLPNPELNSGRRLFDWLLGSGYCWVVLRQGDAPVPEPAEARWRGVPVVSLHRADLTDPAGYPRHAKVVLVRPDGYIAGVGTEPDRLADAFLPPFSGDRSIDERVGAI